MDVHARTPALDIPGIDDLAPLGRGGFGTVYRGWQPSLRREVAVKVLDAPIADEAAERRFEREAMAMGTLSGHPNVVPVYAAGSVDGRPYLVMPLLRHGSLDDRMRLGPLPPEEVVRVGQGVADALIAAHAAGVLHRDVKPANVLQTDHGAPQLADFGVARLADTTQTMGAQVVATVPYAAPEVLAGEPASERSDVYALGATLHAAARGSAPFEAGPDDTPMSLAVRVMSSDAPDLRPLGVPEGLVEVIERAMARDPQDRYGSAAEMRAALDGLDLAVPVHADEPTVALAPPPEPLAPAPVATAPQSRHRLSPWIVVGLVALLALAVGAALLGADDGSGSEEATTPTTEPPAADPTTTASTAPSTTEAPAAETPSTDTPTTAATSGSGLGTDAAEATRRYYALMDAGRIDEGWASLSPDYQARTGESSYRGFWSGIDAVDVLEVTGDDLSSRARLRYTRTDGSTSTESVSLRFVRQPDGSLLIDDYRVG